VTTLRRISFNMHSNALNSSLSLEPYTHCMLPGGYESEQKCASRSRVSAPVDLDLNFLHVNTVSTKCGVPGKPDTLRYPGEFEASIRFVGNAGSDGKDWAPHKIAGRARDYCMKVQSCCLGSKVTSANIYGALYSQEIHKALQSRKVMDTIHELHGVGCTNWSLTARYLYAAAHTCANRCWTLPQQAIHYAFFTRECIRWCVYSLGSMSVWPENMVQQAMQARTVNVLPFGEFCLHPH